MPTTVAVTKKRVSLLCIERTTQIWVKEKELWDCFGTIANTTECWSFTLVEEKQARETQHSLASSRRTSLSRRKGEHSIAVPRPNENPAGCTNQDCKMQDRPVDLVVSLFSLTRIFLHRNQIWERVSCFFPLRIRIRLFSSLCFATTRERCENELA